MHMGTMKFKQRGREEQAEGDGVVVSGCGRRLLIFGFLFVCFSPIYRRPSPWLVWTASSLTCEHPTHKSCTKQWSLQTAHKQLRTYMASYLPQPCETTRPWTPKGSLWHFGLQSRGERQHLPDRSSRHAPWLDEIQAKGSRRTSRSWRRCRTFLISPATAKKCHCCALLHRTTIINWLLIRKSRYCSFTNLNTRGVQGQKKTKARLPLTNASYLLTDYSWYIENACSALACVVLYLIRFD